MNKNMLTMIVVLIVLLVSTQVLAAVPQTFNIHGRLTNSSNDAVLTGTYNMSFAIYDAYTGGNELWSQENVNVTTGNFATKL